jgi:ketosteroid isomerase-like protein
MRNKEIPLLLTMVLAAAGFLAVNTALASGEDEAAVRSATAQFYTSLNAMLKGDPAPANKVWSHAKDITYMCADGGFRVGWDEVFADWKAQADMKIGGKAEPEDVRITVGKDIAVAHNYVKAESINKAGKPEKKVLRATSVFRKEDGKWKMIGHHVDTLPFLVKWREGRPPTR